MSRAIRKTYFCIYAKTAEQTGLCLTWFETPRTSFLVVFSDADQKWLGF